MRRLAELVLLVAVCLFAAHAAEAAELRVPQTVTAGTEATIGTSGSGSATVYVVGPAAVLKREVKLGEDVRLSPEETRAAGRYTVILRDGGSASTRSFFVTAAQPEKVNFLARPSRVPVSRPQVISGVAFVFDGHQNLVLAPTPVRFDLGVQGGPATTRTVQTRAGIAWLQLDSANREGAAQFVASVGPANERRVVQQTAADACSISMSASRTERALVVQTAPIRDCSGNALPDGTIVTFTQVGPNGRSTVDARIKKGVARAELPLAPGRISVASGVVVGNEIHFGGGR